MCDQRVFTVLSHPFPKRRSSDLVAVERVQEARAQYCIADSDRYPTLGVGGNGQITRNPENLRPSGSESGSVTRYYQAGAAMTSFELDFFGRVKTLSEAAYHQYLATEQARRTVHINLVAQEIGRAHD